jgi:hypothetical protein
MNRKSQITSEFTAFSRKAPLVFAVVASALSAQNLVTVSHSGSQDNSLASV